MKVISFVPGLMISIMAIPAFAGDSVQTIEQKRFGNQNGAIRRQFGKGNLTQEEADKLREEQRQIKQEMQKLKADGDYSAADKARIDAMQDKVRAKITLQSTDAQEGNDKSRAQVRQFNQKQRIKDGLADGSLTEDEANDLKKYIRANAQFIKGAKADGTLTDEELKRIEARQDLESSNIFLKRHNGVQRAPASAVDPNAVDPNLVTNQGPQSVDPVVTDPGTNPTSTLDLPTAGFIPAQGID